MQPVCLLRGISFVFVQEFQAKRNCFMAEILIMFSSVRPGLGFNFGRFSSNSYDRRLDSGSPQAPPGMTVLVGRRYNQALSDPFVPTLCVGTRTRTLCVQFGTCRNRLLSQANGFRQSANAVGDQFTDAERPEGLPTQNVGTSPYNSPEWRIPGLFQSGYGTAAPSSAAFPSLRPKET